MSVPRILFPVAVEDIPGNVQLLMETVHAAEEELRVATRLLDRIRQDCKHPDAKRGSNERDGDWMNPCPACGASYSNGE